MSLTTDNIDFIVPMWTTAGVAATGLDTGAFTITLKEPDGDAVTGLTVAEIGSGLYRLTKAAAWGVAGVWSAQVAHAGAQTTPGAIEIETPVTSTSASAIADAVADELLAGHTVAGSVGEALGLIDDIKTKTDQLGTGTATYTGPVATDGDATVYQTSDYSATTQTISFTSDTTMALTGTPKWTFAGNTFSGTLGGSSGAWTLAFTLTAAQTAALKVGVYTHHVKVLLSGGELTPALIEGRVTVERHLGA